MRAIWLALAGATATGTFLVLALPRGDQAYLAWFAIVPLLVATKGQGFAKGFVAALIAIFSAAFLSTQGILYAHPHSTPDTAWVYTGFGIFGFSVAMVVGFWADKSTRNMPNWWFAALATLLESVLLLQLPAHLALSQYRQPLVVQIASIGGIWLVTFIVWWANFAIASLPWRSEKTYPRLLAGVGLGALTWSLGWIHVPTSGPLTRVATIQTDNPEEEDLTKAQTQASNGGAALVVWPEFSGIGMAPSGDTSALRNLSKTSAPFVTTFGDSFQPLPHNVSMLFTKGEQSAPYAKRKLFGGETNMHTPGTTPVAVPWNGGQLGLNICYDSCFPQIIRETARLPGVDLICVPSIDPASSNDFVAAIHASYTPFRSAEEGVAMIKADGLAFSMVTDAYGQIVAQAGAGDQVQFAEVPLKTHWTPYKTLGDRFLWLCGVLLLAGIWRNRRAETRAS